MSKDIGFIGAGYMGYGIAKNLIKHNFNLKVIVHKNRKPIDKLIALGAKESFNYDQLVSKINFLIMCVPNTKIAKKISKEIAPKLKKKSLVIDITTHNKYGSIEVNRIFNNFNIKYIESPVMGGPIQAEAGVLGCIVGGSYKNLKLSKKILNSFSKNIYHFGDVGSGAKAKLISNFLALGTTTFVIETIKAAEHLNIDIKKLYDVAKLGSGNSGALKRIADKAIKGDYKGYIFSVDNALKDLTYIHEILKDIPNAAKLSNLSKSFYKEAVKKGYGNLLISELIKK